jgi:serine protease Do
MQDRLNGDDRELNSNNNDLGIDNFSEGKKDYENNQNNEESGENYKKELQSEIEANERKGQDNDKEAQYDKKEVEDAQGPEGITEKDSENEGQQTASTTYAPPYYTPRMSSWSTEKITDKPKDKEKRRSNAWVITVCVILSLAIAAFVGAFSGYYAVYSLAKISGASSTGTIIKNNGRVEVNKVVQDGDYSAMNVSEVAAAVKDSVVEITTSSIQTDMLFGQYVTSGAGSGVIILQADVSNVGYIVTNYHVVEGAKEITVLLNNGNEYKASYRAGDEAMDIAVIEIQAAETLVCAEIGNSDKLSVGDEVVAIGNPLGELGGTVTNGIISALERKIIVENNAMVLLQTNAAINPGNSGGGLFDMGGKLIGIVNAKESSAGIEGLGFAIPINRIEQAIEDILSEDGYVKGRPTLSIRVSYDSWNNGLYVAGVSDGSPFHTGDKIISVNGTEVKSELEYNIIVSGLEIGSQATLSIVRQGRLIEITVTVSENTSV